MAWTKPTLEWNWVLLLRDGGSEVITEQAQGEKQALTKISEPF